jgi:hypothetical protein
MQEEIWKDIPNYEGRYQVSNLGRVKSLPRKIYNHRGCFISKEKILSQHQNKNGYLSIIISDFNFILKRHYVHRLVAMAFLNHIPCGNKLVIDHINNIKNDNRFENIQIVTHRVNLSKDKKNKTSKYTGVCWHNRDKYWQASIKIKGKYKYLGSFKNESEAYLAYQNELNKITNQNGNKSTLSNK